MLHGCEVQQLHILVDHGCTVDATDVTHDCDVVAQCECVVHFVVLGTVTKLMLTCDGARLA